MQRQRCGQRFDIGRAEAEVRAGVGDLFERRDAAALSECAIHDGEREITRAFFILRLQAPEGVAREFGIERKHRRDLERAAREFGAAQQIEGIVLEPRGNERRRRDLELLEHMPERDDLPIDGAAIPRGQVIDPVNREVGVGGNEVDIEADRRRHEDPHELQAFSLRQRPRLQYRQLRNPAMRGLGNARDSPRGQNTDEVGAIGGRRMKIAIQIVIGDDNACERLRREGRGKRGFHLALAESVHDLIQVRGGEGLGRLCAKA